METGVSKMTDNNDLLKLVDVAKLLAVSRTTVYRIIEGDKTFPKPYQFGERTSRWAKDDILNWIEEKKIAPTLREEG
jgi:predicted DNA-binding transcriptional regulator AlpA